VWCGREGLIAYREAEIQNRRFASDKRQPRVWKRSSLWGGGQEVKNNPSTNAERDTGPDNE